jgi:hypothetical protein
MRQVSDRDLPGPLPLLSPGHRGLGFLSFYRSALGWVSFPGKVIKVSLTRLNLV